MKLLKFILVVFLLNLNPLWAGHEKGGITITYESVAGATGNPLAYAVTGYALSSTPGPPPPSSKTLSLSSSCFVNTNYQLPLTGTSGISTQSDYCTPGTSISSSTNVAVYHDTIILPGTCSDFLFHVTGNAGLYTTTDNIDDPFTMNPYFYAELDNTNGPNSSPVPQLADLIQGVCTGYPLNLYGFTEQDGDSMYYSASAPARINSSGNVSDFGYLPGYSIANPVGSSQGYSLDSVTGQVQTQLSASGNFLVTIQYEEYRFDTTTMAMEEIGEGRFMMLLVGSGSCVSASFDLAYPDIPDPDSLECGQNIIQIGTSRRLVPSSITSSGSEFIVASTSGNLSVTGAKATSDSVVEIQLAQPLASNEVVYVTTQAGSDNDVIMSYCGKELTALQDSLWFYTTSAVSPTAAFSHSASLLDVNFNSSGTTGDSLSWDFGDGSAAVGAANPFHTYSSPGQYTISLVAFNKCGETDTLTKSIEVCDTLIASFVVNNNNDTLSFDAGASSGVQDYHWDFGDGSTDQGSLVYYSYSGGGSFVVTLTATNACGDTAVFRDTVETCAEAVPIWTYEVANTGGSGMTVDFDGSRSLNAVTYFWDFGDGNTNNTTLTPTHTYNVPSLSYYVSLSVANACGDTVIYGYRLSEIGLQEISTLPQLKLYPNPASEDLWVEADEDIASVSIFTADGKKLSENRYGKDVAETTISVREIPTGLYLVRVQLKSGAKAVSKIFIE